MKNFKLLLATTAILSTVLAMNVKADDPITATMNVKAGIISLDKIIITQDLDFGHIIDPSDDFVAVVNPVTGNTTGSHFPVGSVQNGIVILASITPKTISLPESVTLTNNAGSELKLTPSFGVIDEIIQNYGAGPRKDVTYGIGGTLRPGDNYLPDSRDGIYAGELTITAVADE